MTWPLFVALVGLLMAVLGVAGELDRRDKEMRELRDKRSPQLNFEIGPDEMGQGTSWEDRDDAERAAEMLNAAFACRHLLGRPSRR